MKSEHWISATIAVIAACSGSGAAGGTGGGSTLTEQEWAAYCDGHVKREQTCDAGNPPTPSQNECLRAQSCADAMIRPAAQKPFLACLTERPCSKSDDACMVEVSQAIGAVPEQTTYEQACLSKLNECGKQVLSDDFCTDGDVPWKLFPAAVYGQLSPCFSKPCSQVMACLEAAGASTFSSCSSDVFF